jgi:hypothetical protein
MKRRTFLNKTLMTGIGSFISAGSLKPMANKSPEQINVDKIMDSNDIIPAPDDPSLWNQWHADLLDWRVKKQQQLNYNGSSYRIEAFKWVTSNYACSFVMMYDSEFYNYTGIKYNIDLLIENGKQKFGGYDSVVLWHAYPRIGLDARNQFDFYREMPGGLTGLKEVVKQFHNSDIRVFIDYNPWDTGTRRENKSDLDLLIEILQSTDADGIFLDTMKNAPDFREKLDKIRPGIVMEGEIALPLEDVQTHHMSWAQWFNDSNAPGVYRNKWFERCHMQHAIARWETDKSPQLQTAWMNGSGILVWENIFGQWLGWNKRDAGTYRIMTSVQRHFSEIFSGEKWTPLTAESPVKGVYISLWEKEDIRLWTLINRNESPAEGILLKAEYNSKTLYYNIVKGEKASGDILNGYISLTGNIAGRGIGCFLALPARKDNNTFKNFLAEQKLISNSLTVEITIPEKTNKPVRIPEHVKYSVSPKGMIEIPSASTKMTMEYTFRECGGYGNISEHLSLALSHKLHSICTITRNADIRKFAIDETPVTNAQYYEFLSATGYRPIVAENFLSHWIKGQIPAGLEDHPVVYVDMNDAVAYARWARKRLPTEEEWQLAAQGSEGLNYPWGNEMKDNKCNPHTNGITTPVRAFPQGVSPYGCFDMCGNTWEMTANEYSDGRTRFIMLKGGSCFKADGSVWYMDGGPQKNSFIAKMLLMYPGLDRCATVGFRCVVDLSV